MAPARKPKQQITPAQVRAVLEPAHVEIVESGFAGMTFEAVLDQIVGQLEDVLADCSVQGAQAATDMLLGNVLAVTQASEGDYAAKEAAIRFCQTCLPYVMQDAAQERLSGAYRQLKAQLNGAKTHG